MNPVALFLVLFVGVPLFELYLLMKVGGEIGAIPTITLSVFTAVLGGLLVRTQGFATAMKVRQAMDRGEVPAEQMLEAVLLLMAGMLLLLPGFVTDVVGFLCLVPTVRRLLVSGFFKRAKVTQASSPGARGAPPGQRIIEGEYRRED